MGILCSLPSGEQEIFLQLSHIFLLVSVNPAQWQLFPYFALRKTAQSSRCCQTERGPCLAHPWPGNLAPFVKFTKPHQAHFKGGFRWSPIRRDHLSHHCKGQFYMKAFLESLQKIFTLLGWVQPRGSEMWGNISSTPFAVSFQFLKSAAKKPSEEVLQQLVPGILRLFGATVTVLTKTCSFSSAGQARSFQ